MIVTNRHEPAQTGSVLPKNIIALPSTSGQILASEKSIQAKHVYYFHPKYQEERQMSIVRESLSSTWSWTRIFLIIVVVSTVFATINEGGAGAATKLVGAGGATIFLSIIIFIIYLIKNTITSSSSQK